MNKRNIGLAILFTFITCGIYGIYWFIVMTDDMNKLSSEDGFTTSGGIAFLLTLVTCGIYGYYWAYKMGQKMNALTGDPNNTVLFLILQIFGLGIVNYCIMQSEINKHAE